MKNKLNSFNLKVKNREELKLKFVLKSLILEINNKLNGSFDAELYAFKKYFKSVIKNKNLKNVKVDTNNFRMLNYNDDENDIYEYMVEIINENLNRKNINKSKKDVKLLNKQKRGIKMKILKKLQDRVLQKVYKDKETGIEFNVRYDTAFIMTSKKVIEADLFDDNDRGLMINRCLSNICLEEDQLELFDIYIDFPSGFYREFAGREDYVKFLIAHTQRTIIEKELKFLGKLKKELENLLLVSDDYEKDKRLIKELVGFWVS